jgi:hypothetical protein
MRFPEFIDSRHVKMISLSALRTGRLYPQEIFLILIATRRWVDSRALVRPEGWSRWTIPVTLIIVALLLLLLNAIPRVESASLYLCRDLRANFNHVCAAEPVLSSHCMLTCRVWIPDLKLPTLSCILHFMQHSVRIPLHPIFLININLSKRFLYSFARYFQLKLWAATYYYYYYY